MIMKYYMIFFLIFLSSPFLDTHFLLKNMAVSGNNCASKARVGQACDFSSNLNTHTHTGPMGNFDPLLDIMNSIAPFLAINVYQ